MLPTPAVLEWAQGVIDANPGLPTIVTTHEWLHPAVSGRSGRANGYAAYFEGTDHLPADQVWDRFIRRNAQIFLIHSGHLWTQTAEGVSQDRKSTRLKSRH